MAFHLKKKRPCVSCVLELVYMYHKYINIALQITLNANKLRLTSFKLRAARQHKPLNSRRENLKARRRGCAESVSRARSDWLGATERKQRTEKIQITSSSFVCVCFLRILVSRPSSGRARLGTGWREREKLSIGIRNKPGFFPPLGALMVLRRRALAERQWRFLFFLKVPS